MILADDVRRIAGSLPEFEERETWGHPTFRVRGKIFATLSADGEAAGLNASLHDQAALVTRDPETFSVARYTGRYGWITVRLAKADADELGELIVEAWRRTATKRLVAAFDASR